MKALIIIAMIIAAALGGFILLHYLGYNPIREYRIGAELQRLPARSISIECENKLCQVEAENRERGYQFLFSDFADLKAKVTQIRAVDKSWATAQSQCSQIREEEYFTWCEI